MAATAAKYVNFNMISAPRVELNAAPLCLLVAVRSPRPIGLDVLPGRRDAYWGAKAALRRYSEGVTPA